MTVFWELLVLTLVPAAVIAALMALHVLING